MPPDDKHGHDGDHHVEDHHGQDHHDVPSEPALRVKALESLLVEKGLVEATVTNTRAGTVNACRRAGLFLLSLPGQPYFVSRNGL